MKTLAIMIALLSATQALAQEAFVSVCDRHPAVQKMLVNSLNLECYRISQQQLEQQQLLVFEGNVHELKARDFSGLNHLDTLYLYDTEVKTKDFPAGLFEQLGALKILFISDVHFPVLPKSEFSNLSNLEHFELIDSEIGMLPTDFFVGKAKIKAIGLPSRSLRDQLYPGLKSVTHLTVRDGNVGHLNKIFYSSFPGLKNLNLAHASFEDAKIDMFSSLGALNSFMLYDLDLKPFAEQKIAWPTNVTSLDIVFIDEPAILPEGLFDHLPVSVQEIRLGPAQELETIPDNYFINIKHSPIVIVNSVPLSKTNMAAFNGVAVRGLPTNFGVKETGGTSEEWAP